LSFWLSFFLLNLKLATPVIEKQIKFAENTLNAQRTKFFSGNKRRRTLVYPTAFTHTGTGITFNGKIGSLVLPLKAQRRKKLTKTQIAPWSN
jgi:hypothetical protein